MKNIFRFSSFVLSFVIFSMFFSVSAGASVLSASENLFVNENVLDDAYFVGGNTNVKGDIFGDAYVAGGNVVIGGNVQEDLVVAGGKVNVVGNVGGDVRILGGQVSVFGNIGDDLVVVGGQVDVGKNSIIGGSVIASAALVTIDGTVMEDLRGVFGTIVLNGKINQDVDIIVQDEISVSYGAKIGGDLSYSSLLESKIPKNVVAGQVKFNKSNGVSSSDAIRALILDRILSYIAALIILALVCAFFKNYVLKASDFARNNIMKSVGIGIVSLIALFVGGVFLFFTLVGVPLGMIAFGTGLLLLYFGKIFAAIWLGGYFGKFGKNKKLNEFTIFLWSALGLLVYYVIGIIPFVGWAFTLFASLLGIGTVGYMKMHYIKLFREKKLV